MANAETPSSDGALFAVGEDGTLLTNEPGFCSLMGIPRAVLARGTLDSVLAWLRGSGDETCRSLADLLGAGPPACGTGIIVCANERVIEWIHTSLASASASVRGSLWHFRDASRDRAAARALRDAESWLRMLTAHDDGVVLEVDADLRVVASWGADASARFGMLGGEFHGRSVKELLGPGGDELDRRIRGVLEEKRACSFELTSSIDGERHVFSVNAALLPGDPDEASIVTVLLRDITREARMKAQLEQAERLSSVGLLAAGVAHEINNPLGYMVINLQRVRRGLDGLAAAAAIPSHATTITELSRAIEITLEGAQRVQEIVRGLNHFARSDPDEPRIPVDVRRILATALDMLAPEIEPRARVVCDLGPVPAITASEGRLLQVFLNLVLNAAQAIPAGDPSANEIRVVTRTDERGRVLIELFDTGVGIPDHVVRHIFDPFFTTKVPGAGTGLGLSICHGITTSLGGSISVESKKGCGSVFRVVLPATVAGADAAEAPAV